MTVMYQMAHYPKKKKKKKEKKVRFREKKIGSTLGLFLFFLFRFDYLKCISVQTIPVTASNFSSILVAISLQSYVLVMYFGEL